MSLPTSYAPPPLVPGPTASLPYDPSAPSALITPEEGSPAAAKLARDREMRRLHGSLWRDAVAQSRNAKAASNSGKPHAPAGEGHSAPEAQAPRMVQKAGNANRLEWFDHDLPMTEIRSGAGMKRAEGCTKNPYVFPPPECGDRYFSDYKDTMESYAPLSYELVGGGDPNCTCINQLPEFIVCSDQYLQSTFYDPFDWPKEILDYRNISALWDEQGMKGSCTLWWKIECPEPADTPDGIHQQIDEALKRNIGTRTYLNQTQLDDYLAWRKVNGSADGFRYIRVSDKRAAEAPDGPGTKAATNPAGSDAGVFGVFAAGIGLLTVAAGAAAYYLGRRQPAPTAPTVATTVPQGTQPVAGTTTPSSMASASATLSQGANAAQPAPSSTLSVAATGVPSSTSSDATDDSVLDIPPAGQEDDA